MAFHVGQKLPHHAVEQQKLVHGQLQGSENTPQSSQSDRARSVKTNVNVNRGTLDRKIAATCGVYVSTHHSDNAPYIPNTHQILRNYEIIMCPLFGERTSLQTHLCLKAKGGCTPAHTHNTKGMAPKTLRRGKVRQQYRWCNISTGLTFMRKRIPRICSGSGICTKKPKRW